LKRLAGILKDQSRGTDLVARYGSDEFGILPIDWDLGMAPMVARRVASRLQRDTEEPELSVSIGIAWFPKDGRNALELLPVADRMMYQRKKEHKRGIGSDPATVRTRRA
jgi:diguanylate cyclase (GGDEF)-like protein